MPKSTLSILLLFFLFLPSLSAQNSGIDSLSNILKNSGSNDTLKARVYNELSSAYWYVSLDTAMMYGIKALNYAREQKLLNHEARALNNIGVVFWFKSDYPEALKTLYSALEKYEQEGNDIASLGTTMNNIALIYYSQKNYREAANQYHKVLEIYKTKAPARRNNIATTMGNLAEVYVELDELDSALDYAFKAIDIAKEIGSVRSEANTKIAVGKILTRQKKYQLAEEYLMEGLSIYSGIKSDWNIAHGHKELSILYDSIGLTNDVINHAQKSYQLAKKVGARDLIIESSKILANAYQKINDYKLAFQFQSERMYYERELFNEDKNKEIHQTELKRKDTEIELERRQKELEKVSGERKNTVIISIAGALLSVLILAVLFFRGRQKEKKGNKLLLQKNDEIQKQAQEIKNINQSLAHQNEQITRSINAAQTIQAAILPFNNRISQFLKDYFIIYQPKDIVSGDFYWIEKMDDNQRLVIAADCTGHGVPGAFMSMIGNTLLDEIIIQKEITEPALILDELNKLVIYALRQNENQDLNGMDVAVALLSEPKDGQTTLTFAGAKRPLYYHIPEHQEVQMLKGTNKSIGGRQNEQKGYDSHSLKLPEGTMIYLGSDGYEDQNNKERKKIGRPKLLELLKEISSLPSEEQKAVLEKHLKEHMYATKQRDDIMLLGIRL